MILCDNVNVDFMYITFTLNIYNVSEVNQHWLNRILVFWMGKLKLKQENNG